MLVLMIACRAPEALPGSAVVVSEDVQAEWSDALRDEDSVGELFEVEAVVLGPDGRLSPGVAVTVTLGWDGATVHPADVNTTVGGPHVHLHDEDRTIQLAPCAESGAEDERCTWLELVTDPDGRVALDVFVDVAPDSGASIPVFVTAGDDVQSVEIGFGGDLLVR